MKKKGQRADTWRRVGVKKAASCSLARSNNYLDLHWVEAESHLICHMCGYHTEAFSVRLLFDLGKAYAWGLQAPRNVKCTGTKKKAL